jgi:hypothetical protein
MPRGVRIQWPAGARERAVQLYADGLSCGQVSTVVQAEYGCPPINQGTLVRWIRDAGGDVRPQRARRPIPTPLAADAYARAREKRTGWR